MQVQYLCMCAQMYEQRCGVHDKVANMSQDRSRRAKDLGTWNPQFLLIWMQAL